MTTGRRGVNSQAERPTRTRNDEQLADCRGNQQRERGQRRKPSGETAPGAQMQNSPSQYYKASAAIEEEGEVPTAVAKSGESRSEIEQRRSATVPAPTASHSVRPIGVATLGASAASAALPVSVLSRLGLSDAWRPGP
jgi:hypothetical protein